MNDFFSKLENFLFDILGLILPGAIFLMILLSPVLFVNIDGVPAATVDGSVILSALQTVYHILKINWAAYPKSSLTILTIIAYLMGHTVKVFSRIKYELLTAVFDDGLNRPVISGYERICGWLFRNPSSPVYLRLKELLRPLGTVLEYLFTFRAADFFAGDAVLKENCLQLVKSRLSVDYPDDTRLVTKLSGVITTQESMKTLGPFFLAKYNLYRSLALIFVITTLYYIGFFRVAGAFISPSIQEISRLIVTTMVILWFTFHVKYKRYWTLYGDERIVSLFYILNKKKLYEG
ncbi:hypothetical protein ACQ86N_37195 [Puia sp. P3]|uniref:hypothetical protein n=1 Tax=Puia sp. P3 TaxID=3423952 RepID=UPI003D6715D5